MNNQSGQVKVKVANSRVKIKFTICFVIFAVIIAGAAVVIKWSTFMGATSSSNNMSPPVIVPAKEKATASLIFLHGLGDTGHGWAELFRELKLNHIRCVCPHAPLKPVSLNGGMVMPSWFDIKGLGPNSPEDEEGIKSGAKDLQDLIAKEVSEGISPERIVIGGFSQGGSLALYTALGTDVKVGGLLIMSSWMPLHKQFSSGAALLRKEGPSCFSFLRNPFKCLKRKIPKYNENVPVLQCHGMMDPMVPFQWGKATSEIIKSIAPNAQFKSYGDLGHSSSKKEMDDVKTFLYEILKES